MASWPCPGRIRQRCCCECWMRRSAAQGLTFKTGFPGLAFRTGLARAGWPFPPAGQNRAQLIERWAGRLKSTASPAGDPASAGCRAGAINQPSGQAELIFRKLKPCPYCRPQPAQYWPADTDFPAPPQPADCAWLRQQTKPVNQLHLPKRRAPPASARPAMRPVNGQPHRQISI